MNSPITPTTTDEIRLMVHQAVEAGARSAHRRPTAAQRAAHIAQQVQTAWPSGPADWHRRACPVGHRIILCGDLGDTTDEMRERLVEWQALGVTHIIDVRIEAALDWWGRSTGADVPMDRLVEWFDQNQVDVGWIISRIAQRRYE